MLRRIHNTKIYFRTNVEIYKHPVVILLQYVLRCTSIISKTYFPVKVLLYYVELPTGGESCKSKEKVELYTF